MNNPLFHHSASEPKVTVALVIEGQTASFGLSRCARNDQFSKKKGRLIAEGRARKNPYAKGPVPHENFSQWFRLHAEQMIEEVQKDARLLNYEPEKPSEKPTITLIRAESSHTGTILKLV